MSTEPVPHNVASGSDVPSGETVEISEQDLIPDPGDLQPLGLRELLAFLCGRSGAIRKVAASPAALRWGFLWVLLAGLMREYDQEDLLHEPWHAGIPFAASLVLAGLLFVVVEVVNWRNRPAWIAYPDRFRRLLTTLWMTAPLAVVYVVPVEYFASAKTATLWNLRMLLLVSIWRVLLMTRIISLLYAIDFKRAFGPIMLLADSILLLLLRYIPFPLLEFMGGVRLAASEQIIADVLMGLIPLGFLSWPLWLGWTVWSVCSAGRAPVPGPGPAVRVRSGSWVVVAFLLGGMLLACRWTQPAQQKRTFVERQLTARSPGPLSPGLARLTPAELPPHWDPPPRVINHLATSEVFLTLRFLLDRPESPDWLMQRYLDKLVQCVGRDFVSARLFWNELVGPPGQSSNGRTNPRDDLRTLVQVLQRYPQRQEDFFQDEFQSEFILYLEEHNNPHDSEAAGLTLELLNMIPQTQYNAERIAALRQSLEKELSQSN